MTQADANSIAFTFTIPVVTPLSSSSGASSEGGGNATATQGGEDGATAGDEAQTTAANVTRKRLRINFLEMPTDQVRCAHIPLGREG